jgi:Family of unknown function (DUF6350)
MSVPEDPRSHGRGTPFEGTTSAEPDQAVPTAGPRDISNRPTVRLPAQRRSRPPDRPGRKGAPLVVAGVVNALWAAILTFVPLLAITAGVTAIGAARPAFFDTLRYGLAAWLLSYGVPLQLAGYPIAIVPLLVTGFAWWRIVRAGRNTVRAVRGRGRGSWRVTGGACLAIAAPYAVLGFGCAVLTNGSGISASPARAALTLALFAALAGGLGAGAATGSTRRMWWRLPPLVRDGARAGAVGSLLVLGAGALAAGVAIAAAGGDAADLLHRYHTGVVGQGALVAICLVYAPNVAVWATAFLAGPGFTLAGVPALPVFAGLPDKPLTGAAQAVLAVPVVAGVASGLLLMRKPGVAPRLSAKWRLTMLAAALAGVSSALLLALAGRVAAGSLGIGLLADMGQVGWQFPVIAGVGIGLGSLIGLIFGRARTPTA